MTDTNARRSAGATSPDEALLDEAAAARDRSHVPYSGFSMGAAVRSEHGGLIPGAVVENVSLGLAMCAERVAMFSAVARGERPVALALVAPRTDGTLAWPCGACLQVGLELGGPDLAVHVRDPGGDSATSPLRDLLPRGPYRPDLATSS